ncbi:unnamed protein product [Clonostachys rosea]|uniref:MADS-box domain-containing protein n=1 Tax=Bionectria ochroleuca TaxID=29856 RepID=A0ABY6UGD1_BIOOC|nr:unnamed protein product [Clonostachys rosea]
MEPRMTKADPETRKLIRSQCMRGKNRGRILYSRRKIKKTAIPFQSEAGSLNARLAPSIPSKVGSELSLVQFADAIEPSTLYEVLKCESLPTEKPFNEDGG